MTNFRMLIYKIKLIIDIGKPKTGAYLKTCGKCGGIRFDKLCDEGKEKYKAKFLCRRCGAIGDINENWQESEVE